MDRPRRRGVGIGGHEMPRAPALMRSGPATLLFAFACCTLGRLRHLRANRRHLWMLELMPSIYAAINVGGGSFNWRPGDAPSTYFSDHDIIAHAGLARASSRRHRPFYAVLLAGRRRRPR